MRLDHPAAGSGLAGTGSLGLIESSWQRAEEHGLGPGHELALPFDGDRDGETRLGRAADPVLDRLARQLTGSSMCVMLGDSRGWIVRREAASSQLARKLDRITIVQGALASEETAATNGLGTVLVERRPLVLKGADHFIESMQVFTCVGAPIIHPITGRLEGVLDLSCSVEDTNDLLLPLITAAAGEIEQRLYDLASMRERALFDAFVTRNRRTSHAVACLNEDVLFTNTRAAQLFDPHDHALLWDWAVGVVRTGRETTGTVVLSGARAVVAHASPVSDRTGAAGVLVTFAEARPRSQQSVEVPRAAKGSPGRNSWSEAWRGVQRAVAQARLVPGCVLLRGEPGVGKATLARTVLIDDGGREDDPVDLDCRSSESGGTGWAAAAVRAVEVGRPVLLRHVEAAEPDAAVAVCHAARRAATPRIAMTGSAAELPCHWESVVDVVIEVPPLRDRRADIPALVDEVIRERVGAGRRVRCTAAALALLMARQWLGNTTELRRTVATALVNSMHCDITEHDLPQECRPRQRSGSRRLTDLELAERDTIVAALRSVGWKREAAAASLGVSRATIYRKIRHLGITDPPRR
ncbi:sigma-54-dependent Fis family transcriptional regulator [Pseudonocardia abyssalis]|uniref:GAF domain-containing protein n=1 Tax=Pseudonocardia abyssalis TaxID=2792008 RepID=A0ABS6UWM9_9PSEU|nr:GAF domain-containing protein [Pseudonocardia abyssalis]MBW0114678.1 GAF domain-containing protein [Pseudonocardia abyssalis]MBW0136673.1 GAF domain-containing protein [Pseudonocardia abyssalis]